MNNPFPVISKDEEIRDLKRMIEFATQQLKAAICDNIELKEQIRAKDCIIDRLKREKFLLLQELRME